MLIEAAVEHDNFRIRNESTGQEMIAYASFLVEFVQTDAFLRQGQLIWRTSCPRSEIKAPMTSMTKKIVFRRRATQQEQSRALAER